jgi:uncharacterized protein (DUF1800 family)
MTPEFETFASIRYGYGLSPLVAAPRDVGAMLDFLRGPDRMADVLPITGFEIRAEEERALGELRKARRDKKAGAEEAFKAANIVAVTGQAQDLVTSVLRPMLSPDGFRERLVRFWADHFTVAARGKGLRDVTTAYVEDAIRPHINGNFRELLRAVETHPAMLIYLDQILSFGPNSKIGKRAKRGLNENLAREILELHTLGVGGAYTQKDVRQFAELLTGLNFNFRTGGQFRVGAAEPGAEIVLGRSYGDDGPADMADILAALDDIALHPDTARHLARKLAVHFIADEPDEDLVASMAGTYRDSAGDLMAVYEAMLGHPAAWAGFGQKAKQPFDFIVSTLRAFGLKEERFQGLKLRQIRQYLSGPMQTMGQAWQQANGPNGFPEEMDQWITPQGLAARIEWALIMTQDLKIETDPQDFARTALGDVADARLLRLVGAAESRAEGIALVLASPEFNRR